MRKQILAVLVSVTVLLGGSKKKESAVSAYDQYIQEAIAHANDGTTQARTAGSLWTPSSPLSDIGRDPKARFVDDMLTILVIEQASAVANGTVSANRQSSLKNSIAKVAGITKATGPLANLADLSNESKLTGDGSTSRDTTVTATLAARVVRVLPNGLMAIEGAKEVQVNSERQLITVRGVANPIDISSGNIIRSDRLAQMEVRVNGKGVVGDAVRRPFFLYRLIMGLLPF